MGHIYKFDGDAETWTLDASTEFPHRLHAADLVNYEDFKKYCS